jgi:hypothetical protein
MLINPVSLHALVSIRDNLDLEANITDGSEWKSSKDDILMNSIDARRIIPINPVSLNALVSIRGNLDCDSNALIKSVISRVVRFNGL